MCDPGIATQRLGAPMQPMLVGFSYSQSVSYQMAVLHPLIYFFLFNEELKTQKAQMML